MKRNAKIFILGASGLLGSALQRLLQAEGYLHLLTPSHSSLNLENQTEVNTFFQKERPDVVFLLAARVGGILANIREPAMFLYQNLAIQTNVIHAAYQSGCRRLLYAGSSCIYPRLAKQPMKEDYLLTGPVESTNEAYAIAKIAGLKMVTAYNAQYGTHYLAPIFPNLYGPGDNFSLEDSHVVSALIRRLYEAKLQQAPSVEILGDGTARREFLYVEDAALACLFLMGLEHPPTPINMGAGEDISIRELAHLIAEIVAYPGELVFNPDRPSGMPQKLLDSTKAEGLGWRARSPLREGLVKTLTWYQDEKICHSVY